MTDEIDYVYRNNILIMDNTISDDQCDAMIDYFEKSRKHGMGWQAKVAERKDEQLPITSVETMNIYDPTFLPDYMEMFWGKLYATYRELNPYLDTLPEHAIHWLKLQKTPIGGGFHNFHHEQGGRKHDNLNRILVVMTYLNDVKEGGETEFLDQNIRVSTKRGRSVLWPAYFTHPHRGNPPLSNEKYILTGWVEV